MLPDYAGGEPVDKKPKDGVQNLVPWALQILFQNEDGLSRPCFGSTGVRSSNETSETRYFQNLRTTRTAECFENELQRRYPRNTSPQALPGICFVVGKHDVQLTLENPIIQK